MAFAMPGNSPQVRVSSNSRSTSAVPLTAITPRTRKWSALPNSTSVGVSGVEIIE